MLFPIFETASYNIVLLHDRSPGFYFFLKSLILDNALFARMKILITILGFLNGGYMLLDGIYVLMKGKYIGPEKPGPWSNLFSSIGVDVFKLGPLFIVFGVLWLFWLWSLWTHQNWSFLFGVLLSIFTLWYLPVGTLFSVIILLVLLLARQKLGI